jgi:hypothetical protein
MKKIDGFDQRVLRDEPGGNPTRQTPREKRQNLDHALTPIPDFLIFAVRSTRSSRHGDGR